MASQGFRRTDNGSWTERPASPARRICWRRVASFASVLPHDDEGGSMAIVSRHSEHHYVDVVRTCLTVGFWLLAAGASALLGLDIEVSGRP